MTCVWEDKAFRTCGWIWLWCKIQRDATCRATCMVRQAPPLHYDCGFPLVCPPSNAYAPPTTTTPTSSQFPNVSFSTRHFKPLFQSKLYQQKCVFLVLYLTTQQTCEVLLTFKTFDRINEGTRSEHPKDNNKNKDKTISEISVAPW